MARYDVMLMPRALDIVRFGDFELDVRAYELRCNGRPVRLERRPMDLLIFLVERRGELVTRTDIVDQLWGKDVFIEVEPAVNTAIKKIRRALNDSPDAPTFVETIPGRGYRFVAPVTNADAAARASAAAVAAVPDVPAAGSRFRGLGLVIAAVVLFAVATVAWQWWSASQDSGKPTQLVALTTLTGSERGATFSPDGRQVVFTWSGEAQDNWDIYVKLVGSPDVRRLTTHPAREIAPRWSFDGRHIVYTRAEPSGVERLRVMSALGGSDRQLSELAILPQPAWSPDDQWIAAGLSPAQTGKPRGIYLMPLNGGEPRPLTQSPAGGVDWMAAFSSDGRQLAYGLCRDSTTNCHVHVLTLNAGFQVQGSPRRLTPEPLGSIRGIAWSRDGSSVIYGAIQGTANDVWRVGVDDDAPPQRIEIVGANAAFPATTRSADRLAFTRSVIDEDVYAFEVGGAARPVARSSVFDGNAQFSPDMRKIAFCSDRTADATEVWIANADGSHPEQLTRGPGRWQCSPAWAPNGQSLAFESRSATGESQIYAIDLNVHQPRRLTTGLGDRKLPSWSRNGESVYFSWDQGAGREIWRVPRTGGSPARVTNAGSGLAAVEGADGATLFYLGRRTPRVHEPTDAPLLAQPLAGGPPREVIACVLGTAFSVGAGGIYYLPCRSEAGNAGDPSVLFLDLATRTQRSLGTLERYENKILSGFSASFDGKTFLYSRLISRGEDLMLVENFR